MKITDSGGVPSSNSDFCFLFYELEKGIYPLHYSKLLLFLVILYCLLTTIVYCYCFFFFFSEKVMKKADFHSVLTIIQIPELYNYRQILSILKTESGLSNSFCSENFTRKFKKLISYLFIERFLVRDKLCDRQKLCYRQKCPDI